MSNPRDLLCVWHSFFDRVSKNTKIYEIGPITTFVHNCGKNLSFSDKAARIFERPSTAGKLHNMTMQQPRHDASPAAYCKDCDTLWVTKVENERVQQPRKTVIHHLRSSQSAADASEQPEPGAGLPKPAKRETEG